MLTLIRSAEGTARQEIPFDTLAIPDLSHIAKQLRKDGHPEQSEAVLDAWYLCHDFVWNVRNHWNIEGA